MNNIMKYVFLPLPLVFGLTIVSPDFRLKKVMKCKKDCGLNDGKLPSILEHEPLGTAKVQCFLWCANKALNWMDEHGKINHDAFRFTIGDFYSAQPDQLEAIRIWKECSRILPKNETNLHKLSFIQFKCYHRLARKLNMKKNNSCIARICHN